MIMIAYELLRTQPLRHELVYGIINIQFLVAQLGTEIRSIR